MISYASNLRLREQSKGTTSWDVLTDKMNDKINVTKGTISFVTFKDSRKTTKCKSTKFLSAHY